MEDAIPTRDQLLTAMLGELVEYWLELRCSGCTSVVYVPLRLLATRLGRRHRLQAIVKRLRCEHCVTAPRVLRATDYPVDDQHYGGRHSTWCVDLLGDA